MASLGLDRLGTPYRAALPAPRAACLVALHSLATTLSQTGHRLDNTGAASPTRGGPCLNPTALKWQTEKDRLLRGPITQKSGCSGAQRKSTSRSRLTKSGLSGGFLGVHRGAAFYLLAECRSETSSYTLRTVSRCAYPKGRTEGQPAEGFYRGSRFGHGPGRREDGR